MNIDELKQAAKAGDPDAQCQLGTACDLGDGGVPQDHAKAVKWYRKAADQGHPAAMAYLGCHYAAGLSIGYDYPEVGDWLSAAAAVGNANAHRAIGELLCAGVFREIKAARNVFAGLSHYVQAAKLGDPESQYRVGEMYYHGVGLDVDHAKAAEWFEKAASANYVMAQVLLANMYLSGDGVEQSGTDATVWFFKAMQNGYCLSYDLVDKLAALGIHLETKADQPENNNQNGGNDDGRDEIVEPVD